MQNDAPTRPQKAPRYLWLLPLALLFAAALACDDYYVPPPMIGRVEADVNTAGRVYAEVVNIGLSYADSSNDKPGERATYLSDDYGVNWRVAEHVFADADSGRVPIEVYGESVILTNGANWSFPRSVFRGIFYDGGNHPSEKRFELPSGIVSGSQQGDWLFVPLGTEGVLALRASSDYRDWTLSAKGIDALSPLPLTITQPSNILGVVVLALLIPPFALIHAYLLSRVWVYLLPVREAWRAALKTTAGLVVLAIVGIIFWLTNVRTDLYQVIGVLTVITVIIGVSLTVYMAMQRQVSDYSRNGLTVAALVLSLVVPGGVAAIFAMWWLVFGLVFAYWAYQRVYAYYLRDTEATPEGRMRRWWVDRLAIETLFLIGTAVVAAGATLSIVDNVLLRVTGRLYLDNILILPAVIAIFCLLYISIRGYANRRALSFLKMRTEPAPGLDLHYPNHALVRRLTVHTVLWVVLALIASAATLFGQGWAYGWFTSLLKGP